ncbi:MAG: hypothetical protein H6752_05175 [Candidatus Omnitrophica bacterium]|nr:hypothetical protein [Candidatus Omnitrophota bacterium]
MMVNPVAFHSRINPRAKLALIIPVCLLADPVIALDRIVEITNGAAIPLQQTVIEIRLSDIESFAGGDFRLDYDPTLLSIDDIQPASSTSSFLMAYDFPETGMLAVSLASVEGLATSGEAAILQIALSPLSSATVGTVTPIVFHLARWYDENSVRYRLLADNALFSVGDTPPHEELLAVEVGSDSGFPRGFVRVPLSISMGAGIGEVSGEIHFDPATLKSRGFVPTLELVGWSTSIQPRVESLAFSLRGDREFLGIDRVDLGWFDFEVSAISSIGTAIPVDLQDTEARSLEGCPFLSEFENGQVFIGDPPSAVESWFLLDP